jgi:hypothetical protein
MTSVTTPGYFFADDTTYSEEIQDPLRNDDQVK